MFITNHPISRCVYKFTILILAACVICLFSNTSTSAYIEREYTVREVLDACTGIIFGEIKSVNSRRLTGIVTVKENVKGTYHFKEIKMNFTTGDYRPGTSPQKMVGLLEPKMPIIIFYREHKGIDSLCFIDNTWFQMRVSQGKKTERWWAFTHIDPLMLRTFDGKTTAFQKIVNGMLAGEMWVDAPENAVHVLVLTGNSTPPIWSETPLETNTLTYEYQTLQSIKIADERPIVYEPIKKRTLPHLESADIFWIGYEEISTSGHYLLPIESEKNIKAFVKNGGVVVVTSQDSSPEKPCEVGWLHGTLTGVESPLTQDYVVTESGKPIFSYPNKIQAGKIYVDNAWRDWEKRDEIFAMTQDSKGLVVGARRYGKGLYIITSLRNDNPYATVLNKPLMENILHYIINQTQ